MVAAGILQHGGGNLCEFVLGAAQCRQCSFLRTWRRPAWLGSPRRGGMPRRWAMVSAVLKQCCGCQGKAVGLSALGQCVIAVVL